MNAHTHKNGVVELPPTDPRATVCGACGRGWDDTVSTAWTPAPAGRCPFEYEHDDEEPTSDPWANKSAYDLWNAFVDATADSDASWDFLLDIAVQVGFLESCPTCFHTVSPGQPVGPCEACEGDDE